MKTEYRWSFDRSSFNDWNYVTDDRRMKVVAKVREELSIQTYEKVFKARVLAVTNHVEFDNINKAIQYCEITIKMLGG